MSHYPRIKLSIGQVVVLLGWSLSLRAENKNLASLLAARIFHRREEREQETSYTGQSILEYLPYVFSFESKIRRVDVVGPNTKAAK